MNFKIVTTDDFWELMCESRFVRLSSKLGMVRDDIIYTNNPPEQVTGFMEGKLERYLNFNKSNKGLLAFIT